MNKSPPNSEKSKDAPKPKQSKQKPDLPDFETRTVMNLYSEKELIHNLGDYVADCILSNKRFKEVRRFIYTRILLTLVACLIAGYTTAFISYPKDSFKLLLCILAFFGLLAATTVMDALKVKDAVVTFYDTKTKEEVWIDHTFNRKTAAFTLSVRDKKK